MKIALETVHMGTGGWGRGGETRYFHTRRFWEKVKDEKIKLSFKNIFFCPEYCRAEVSDLFVTTVYHS
jgi:hypothetical protein